jgi:hypothetical protein
LITCSRYFEKIPPIFFKLIFQKMKKLFVLLLIVLLMNLIATETFSQEEEEDLEALVDSANVEGWSASCAKIYGNYCGPGWCGSGYFHGCNGTPQTKTCNTNVKPKDALDSCCQVHDKCCLDAKAKGNSCSNCDANLIACTGKAKCKTFDFGCKAARFGIKEFFKARHLFSKKSCC